MKAQVTSARGSKAAGDIELADEIFGLEVRNRSHPSHGALSDAEAHGRHASRPGPLGSRGHGQEDVQAERHRRRASWRQVGTAVPRRRQSIRTEAAQHAIELPKKVRALALRHALSAKAKAGEIVVLDKATSEDGKTAALKEQFAKLEWNNVLIIDGAELEPTFARAARNIPNIDVLPVQGINVYDILRRKKLVLTRAAVAALEARFK